MIDNDKKSQYIPLLRDMLGRIVRINYDGDKEIALKHNIGMTEYHSLKKYFLETFRLDPRTLFEIFEICNSKELTELVYKIDEEKAERLVSSKPPFKQVDLKIKFIFEEELHNIAWRHREEFDKQLHNFLLLVSMLKKGEITKEQFFDENLLPPLRFSVLRNTLFEHYDIDPRIIYSTEELFYGEKAKKALELDLQDLGIEKKQQIAKKLVLLKDPNINKDELIIEFINAKESEAKRIAIMEKYKLNNLLFNGYREYFVRKEKIHPRELYTDYEIAYTKWLLNVLSSLGEEPVKVDLMKDDEIYLSKEEYVDLVMSRAGITNYGTTKSETEKVNQECEKQKVVENTASIERFEPKKENVATRGRQKWKSSDKKKDQKTMIFTTKELKEKIRKYSEEARERGEIKSQTGAMSEYIVGILEAHFKNIEKTDK